MPALAQVVHEFLDDLSRSTNSRNCWRGSMMVTGTSSAEKMVAYSMPMTPAPTTVRLRGTCGSLAMLSLSKMLRSLNGTVFGR